MPTVKAITCNPIGSTAVMPSVAPVATSVQPFVIALITVVPNTEELCSISITSTQKYLYIAYALYTLISRLHYSYNKIKYLSGG